MGFKKKLLATLAAGALTLSMFGGVAANDSAHGIAHLQEGTCKAVIEEATMSFGVWKYDGATNSYSHNSQNTSNFTAKIEEAKPGGACNVSLEFNGLSAPNGDTIDFTHFTGSLTGYGQLPFVGGTVDSPVPLPGGEYKGSVTLNSVPDDVDPETYEGDFIVRVTNAA